LSLLFFSCFFNGQFSTVKCSPLKNANISNVFKFFKKAERRSELQLTNKVLILLEGITPAILVPFDELLVCLSDI